MYRLSGIQAAIGGPHPGLGTHNALLSLTGPSGNEQYLELIAPDPLQTIEPESMAARLGELPGPALVTWAAKCPDMRTTIKQSKLLNLSPHGPVSATRLSPNGETLAWRLMFVNGNDRGLPFFIDWLDTPHPSLSAPTGCVLSSFELSSPEESQLAIELDALGLSIPVKNSTRAMLKAQIESPNGPFELVSNSVLMGFI